MRIALISPYSWTYPGGVSRHAESLAEQMLGAGHDVRLLTPFDPEDRRAARMHGGVRPQRRALPDYVVSLGRTVGWPANGAVSNLALTPLAAQRLRAELCGGRYDVAHIHEPVAPVVGWDALCSAPAELPLVGTFHCYSTNTWSNGLAANVLGARRRLNRLGVRIAVSEAAAWTGSRFYGGRYRIIPNGVDLDPAAEEKSSGGDALELLFVGQVVERKGLPVLLRAFEALREQVPVNLTIVGAERAEVEPLMLDMRAVRVRGKVGDEEKARCLREADVLVAPSLGGESFGMVLTEAFAAGSPVVASDIPGYAGVVRHGTDGLLVAPGDATGLAEALRALALDEPRRLQMATAAGERAARYAWPNIAREVLDAYDDAIAIEAPAPRGATANRLALRAGFKPADGLPAAPPRRLASLEPRDPRTRRERAWVASRRAALVLSVAAGVLLALLALARIGFDHIAASLLTSRPDWVIVALGLMCSSMVLRAIAWHAILRAALPRLRVRRRDALQGTFIGVLMSATLPARLGEPARSLIVARRIGRPRETLPVVLGTIVSQTLLNLVALLVLGVVMFSNVSLFDGHHSALVAAALAPMIALACVLLAPLVLRRGGPARVQAISGRLRAGLRVFRQPRLAAVAVTSQLSAWAVQWLSCFMLLVALGLDGRVGLGGAAAVLFAVNVTAVLPVAPSNLGVFQAACVAVLTGAYHVSSADALAYGIMLQVVEIATAVLMGAPALLKEGLSWRDVRLRTMHSAPVELSALAPRGELTN